MCMFQFGLSGSQQNKNLNVISFNVMCEHKVKKPSQSCSLRRISMMWKLTQSCSCTCSMECELVRSWVAGLVIASCHWKQIYSWTLSSMMPCKASSPSTDTVRVPSTSLLSPTSNTAANTDINTALTTYCSPGLYWCFFAICFHQMFKWSVNHDLWRFSSDHISSSEMIMVLHHPSGF